MVLDRNTAPFIKDAIDFDIQLKPYQKFVLDNGVEVYGYEGGAEEVMMMEMVFFAGNSYEKKNWVAAATNFLLKNGTSTKSAFEINDAFEFYASEHPYENRVQASTSIFNYSKVAEEDKIKYRQKIVDLFLS